MKFTPKHMVSYHGRYRAAGEPFEIEPADVEELQKYGDIEPPHEAAEKEPPRRGRKKE